MALLNPRVVDTARFTYSAERKQFTAFASDFGPLNGPPLFGRVWNDSCDEGLTLRSHATGRECVFVVNHTEVRDGDLLYWRLHPVKGNHIVEDCVSVLIYND